LEGSGGGLMKVLSRKLPGVTEETTVRKDGVSVEILTRHERYCYTNFLRNITLAYTFIALIVQIRAFHGYPWLIEQIAGYVPRVKPRAYEAYLPYFEK
jgi:hypothetical protein